MNRSKVADELAATQRHQLVDPTDCVGPRDFRQDTDRFGRKYRRQQFAKFRVVRRTRLPSIVEGHDLARH
jgi:hypothetical protein